MSLQAFRRSQYHRGQKDSIYANTHAHKKLATSTSKEEQTNSKLFCNV